MWPCTVKNFFLIKQTDALISQIFFSRKSTCFGQFLCPLSGVFHCIFGPGIRHESLMTAFEHDQDGTGTSSIIRTFPLYIRHWYMSCRFGANFQDRPGTSSILVVLEICHQTCMTYTSAECTVENSWWWAEELPETYRFSWKNKFRKLVRLLFWLKRKLKWLSVCCTDMILTVSSAATKCNFPISTLVHLHYISK